MTQPLTGVRVLDLTRLMPGNYAAWTLASFGADVVKVEDTGAGDYMRDFGVQVNGQGALHQLVNRGKRSVVIDLKSDEGREAFLRLVDTADVVIESFRPGVLDRLGVGWDVLRARRPSLVLASTSGYGSRSPLANRAGHDINFAATSGMLDQLGRKGEPPVVPAIPVSDFIGGGLNTAIATLALLSRARATGVGGRVETSIAEGATLIPSNLVADLLAGGAQPERGTADWGGGSGAYNVYALSDGHVAVGAVEPQFWNRMSELLQAPDLVTRRADDAFVRATLTQKFSEMTRAEARELFAEDGSCVDVIATFEETFSSPHAASMEYLRRVPGLDMPVLAPPYRIDGERLAETVPAPFQGEHTAEIMAEVGYDAEQVADLQRRSILAPRDGRAPVLTRD
ncbi:CaiB/BaiF CoA transferase family protein [Nocardioides zeae]|uniref:CoA transferase n=1 Tax=Nocardioides zeae TaxID=1457234 RepID=A0A6P0HM84_9ACTN|nr:CaiB/BaiF CoA-transferase family protein [Nocardioides zeae]NEN79731.1 CoA transferase [Nocardioides zeae]